MVNSAEASTALDVAGETHHFDVYGYRFQLTGDCQFALEGLREDFGHFRCNQSNGDVVRLELLDREPDYDTLPSLEATVYTPRNAVYRDAERRILDFGGGAWGSFGREINGF